MLDSVTDNVLHIPSFNAAVMVVDTTKQSGYASFREGGEGGGGEGEGNVAPPTLGVCYAVTTDALGVVVSSIFAKGLRHGCCSYVCFLVRD